MSNNKARYDVTIGNEMRGTDHIRMSVCYVPTFSEADRNAYRSQGRDKELQAMATWVVPSETNMDVYNRKFAIIGQRPRSPAFNDLPADVGGSWRNFGMEAEDGEIFCVQAFVKSAAAPQPQQGHVLVRTRKGGPLNRIYMPLLNIPGKSIYPQAVFEGHYDIIDLPTVIRAGALYNEMAAALYHNPFQRCPRLQLTELQPETEKKKVMAIKKIIDEEGEVREVARNRPRRIIQAMD